MAENSGLLDGLKDRSPKDGDQSMKPGLTGGTGSVNSEPTRSKPAEQPATIGPRCA